MCSVFAASFACFFEFQWRFRIPQAFICCLKPWLQSELKSRTPLEAKVAAFERCAQLTRNLPRHVELALRVYDLLREAAFGNGHSFVRKAELLNKAKFRQHLADVTQSEFEQSLALLSEHRCTVTEDDRVYLWQWHAHERTVANSLLELLLRVPHHPSDFEALEGRLLLLVAWLIFRLNFSKPMRTFGAT